MNKINHANARFVITKLHKVVNCLKRHIASVHKGMKTHKCLVCDYSSLTKGGLKRHIESGKETTQVFN